MLRFSPVPVGQVHLIEYCTSPYTYATPGLGRKPKRKTFFVYFDNNPYVDHIFTEKNNGGRNFFMCGIAGIICWDGKVAPELIERMDMAQAHRGPDGHGFCAFTPHGSVARTELSRDLPAAPVLLGHRRLAILDPSESASQPMASPDGRFWLLFNGEIYDYVEQRNHLESLGESFTTNSDTEVLLRMLVREGVTALSHITGMFSLALLDKKRNTLLLARDFFGIKPLYFCQEGHQFLFASEIKSLLAIRQTKPKAHAPAVRDYLINGRTDHNSFTLFEGIHHLPAGHWMEINLCEQETPEPKPLYSLPEKPHHTTNAEDFRKTFLQSVTLHMRSDVPFGAALSGGLDSSAIAAAMRLARPEDPFHVVSYVPEDPNLDESRYAQKVADTLHMERLTTSSHPMDWDQLIQLIHIQDEPFGSTSILAQNAVYARAAQAGITVMLDGQGADEMLAGYPACVGAAAASMFFQGRLSAAIKTASSISGASTAAMGFLVPQVFRDMLMNHAGKGFSARWLNQEWLIERQAGRTPLHPPFRRDPLRPYLDRLLFSVGLPHLLRYQDRNCMHHGIEARVPFLTTDMYTVCRGLEPKWLITDEGVTKPVLRHSMKTLLPKSILARRDKIGFFTPEQVMMASVSEKVIEVLDMWHDKNNPIRINAAKPCLQAALKGQRPWMPWMWRVLNLLTWANVFDVSFD